MGQRPVDPGRVSFSFLVIRAPIAEEKCGLSECDVAILMAIVVIQCLET